MGAENVLENAKRYPKNVALVGLRGGTGSGWGSGEGYLEGTEGERWESQQRAQKLLEWERRCCRRTCEQLDRGRGLVSEYAAVGLSSQVSVSIWAFEVGVRAVPGPAQILFILTRCCSIARVTASRTASPDCRK